MYLIPGLDVGGTERHLAAVLPCLQMRGIAVRVHAIFQNGPVADELRAAGVDVTSPWLAAGKLRSSRIGKSILLPLDLMRLVLILGSAHARLVHFFLPAAYILGGLISLVTGPRVRVMSRRSLNVYQRRHVMAAGVERWLHQHMNAVIGNSRSVLDDLVAEGVPHDKAVLIHNGVDTDGFRPARDRGSVRRDLGISDDAFVMICTANLLHYKGHADLLRSLQRCRQDLSSEWGLLLVGADRGLLSALQEQARSAGIGAHVKWLGERADIADLCHAADLGLLVSHEEGFSNAILEYMAAGLATVATKVGGNPEAIVDGKTGLLVPKGDVTRLAEAILALAHDHDLRARMGAAALTRARDTFSITRCVDRYVLLYRTLSANAPHMPAELQPNDCAIVGADELT